MFLKSKKVKLTDKCLALSFYAKLWLFILLSKNMNIEIGNRKLSEITQNEALELIILIGAIPSLEFWNIPIIEYFEVDDDKGMYQNVVIDYYSFRKSDELRSDDFRFFIDCKRFSFFYSKGNKFFHEDYKYRRGRDFNIKIIKWLIQRGFEVPIY